MFNKPEDESLIGATNTAPNFIKNPPDSLRRIDQISKNGVNSGNQAAAAMAEVSYPGHGQAPGGSIAPLPTTTAKNNSSSNNSTTKSGGEGGGGNHYRCDSMETPGVVIKPHTGGDARWDAVNMVSKGGSLNLSHFRLLKRLGYGDIGSVYLVELRGTETFFAMKVMDKASLASRNKLLRAQTEREILGLLDHPFLPTLYSYFETDKFYCLVMEFCSGGNLHSLRQKQPNKYFTEEAARSFSFSLLNFVVALFCIGC